MSARDSDSLFRRIFEDGPVGMALVGPDFRLSEANEAFCRFTGYSADELRELTFADITHPDDVDTDLRLARRVFAGEVSGYSIDKRYVRKDGEVVWAELSVFLIRDESGAPVQGMGLVQDISDRHAALTRRTPSWPGWRATTTASWSSPARASTTSTPTAGSPSPTRPRRACWAGDRTRWWASRRTSSSTTPAPTGGPTRARLPDPRTGRVRASARRRDRRPVLAPDGSSFPVHYRSAPVREPGAAWWWCSRT